MVDFVVCGPNTCQMILKITCKQICCHRNHVPLIFFNFLCKFTSYILHIHIRHYFHTGMNNPGNYKDKIGRVVVFVKKSKLASVDGYMMDPNKNCNPSLLYG